MKHLLWFFLPLGLLFSGAWYYQNYQEEEAKAAQYELDARWRFQESSDRMNAEILAEQVKVIRLQRGDAAASTYELCHTQPPTTKKHQQECKQLGALIAKDRKRDAKDRW